MKTYKHFGCKIQNPKNARITRANYAQITHVSRKNSFVSHSPYAIGNFDEVANREITSVEEAISVYLEYDGKQIISQCVDDLEKFKKFAHEKRNSPLDEETFFQYIVLMMKNTIYTFEKCFMSQLPLTRRVEQLITEINYKIDASTTKNNLQKIVSILNEDLSYYIREEDLSQQTKDYWKSALETLRFYAFASTVEDLEIIEKDVISTILLSKKPSFLHTWQYKNGTDSLNMPLSEIQEYVLNTCLYHCPYHTDKWCAEQQKKALLNYDINMAHFAMLDKEKFNREINHFLTVHPGFVEVIDLNNYKDVSGIYIMVLDEYKQIYIGISTNIKRRIQEHWRGSKPLDRLIWGTVETSIISIDSFKHLDTTRIFVNTEIETIDELMDEEKKLVADSFSSEFILNRTSGGGQSFYEAVINRRTLEPLKEKGNND